MAYLLKEDAKEIDAMLAAPGGTLQEKVDKINAFLLQRQFGPRKVIAVVNGNHVRFIMRKRQYEK